MPIPKALFKFTLFIFSFFLILPASQAEEDKALKRDFLVTAYYSPQPDQSFYIRGSYEADINLNGQGTHGADGTPVYIGMIAAPASYPFGTQIYIPGLGVGEVHDRGGAINGGGDYDRLDVWMGYGEEGLSRALNWGSRLVMGEIYKEVEGVQEGFDYSWVNSNLSQATVEELKKNTVKKPNEEINSTIKDTSMMNKKDENLFFLKRPILDPVPVIQKQEAPLNPEVAVLEKSKLNLKPGLGKGSAGQDVEQLQKILHQMGYLQADVTGVYDESTAESVYRLQKENGLVISERDMGAGHFGPKTLQALQATVDKKIEKIKVYPKETQVTLPSKQELPALNNLKVPENLGPRKQLGFDQIPVSALPLIITHVATQSENLNSTLKPNDKGEEVLKLQNKLIEKGYLAQGLNTGFFGPKTQEALLKFQQAR